MAYSIWDVSGKVIIPGTRKNGSFGPVRIVDKDRTTASRHLAVMLNEKFKRELRGDHKFSDGFALMNLKWEPLAKQTTAPTTAQAVEVQAVIQASEQAAE
jgi:hypothetical protein